MQKRPAQSAGLFACYCQAAENRSWFLHLGGGSSRGSLLGRLGSVGLLSLVRAAGGSHRGVGLHRGATGVRCGLGAESEGGQDQGAQELGHVYFSGLWVCLCIRAHLTPGVTLVLQVIGCRTRETRCASRPVHNGTPDSSVDKYFVGAWVHLRWPRRHRPLMANIRPVRRILPAGLPALTLLFCLLASAPAWAAPYLPAADSQVLATVPARASDPRARDLVALRAAWRAQPNDVNAAVRLAQRYFDEVAAEGDPRYVGYAQAALQPWWALPDPPVAVRVLRAMLVQFDHRFDAALADLDAVVAAEPENAAAWSWRTAILMVQARYPEARLSCEQMAELTSELVAVACRAQVDAATGHAGPAAAALRAALLAARDAGPDERLWCLTRLAETEERRGAFPAAEAAFREALALGIPDVYLQAAYADFLLDRGRPAEVLVLLKDLSLIHI